jgi:hypothetical protein
VEVGLHFEDEAAYNARLCRSLAARALELRHALGPLLEAEEWTQSWQRLHLTVPMKTLDERYAAELAAVLGRLVELTHSDVKAGPA